MAIPITADDLGKDNSNILGQDQQNTQAPQAGQAPQDTGAQASSGQNNPNQQKASGYTNISKVIQANQGNQLGAAVGNNIQQVGNAAQDNLKNAQNSFQQDSQKNQFNTDQNKQTVQNVLNDPTKFVGQNQTNPNGVQANQFKTLISGQYQGPQGLNNASQLQSQANNVAQMGQALSSSGGRYGLLQQTIGNPQYTAGAQNLDSLLLGQSTDPALQAAKRQSLMLKGQVGNAIAGAQAQGQQNVNEAQQFGNQVRDQFGNVITGQQDQLQQKATQAQSDRDSAYAAAIGRYQSGNITQADADLLGLTNNENVLDTLKNPNAWVTENADKAAANTIAGSDDYAKMQALQSLGGQYANTNQQQILSQYQDPTKANSFQNEQAITGDKVGFQTQLDKENANYHSIYDPAAQQVNQANEIWNLASGKVSDTDVNNFLQQNPSYAQMGANPSDPNFRHIVSQYVLQQKYPGAVTNGGTRMDWANSNAATAKQKFADAQATLQNQYGNQESINIQPSSYPGISKIPGSSS